MTVDMFKDILPSVHKAERNFYNKLPPELKKSSQVNFWMIHRWVSSGYNNKEYYIRALNDWCNDHYSDISNHPELQWLLLTKVGMDGLKMHFNADRFGGQKYPKGCFVGTPNSRIKESAIDKFLLDVYPTMNNEELTLLKETNTNDDFQDLARRLGYTDKQISDIFNEKRRSKKK